MNDRETHRCRIAVVGGGIAGLAAAQRALELDPAASITLFEAGSRLGGSLFTERRDGFLIEHGADSFITNVPEAIDLCRRIGFEDQLISTGETNRRAFVVRRGRLLPVPEGFALMAPAKIWPIVKTPILSTAGKLRMAWEYLVPARRDERDESLASFVRRRLGRQVFDRLVQPLVAGIYTADPERLSLAATLPRFQEMERTDGGLIRAALRQRRTNDVASSTASGARYSLFVTPRDGLSSMVAAIAKRLPADSVRLNSCVFGLDRSGSGWRLALATPENGANRERSNGDGEFDAVVLASPAHIISRLLASIDAELSADLAGIEYASTAVISLAYHIRQIVHPLDGFGFVVPAIERRKILSASFSSEKFPGRAPSGHVLLRVFVGGATQAELLNLGDSELVELAAHEIADLLKVSGQPVLSTVARWSQAMPQYHLGHLDRVARIENRLAGIGGLTLAGNGYRGVGIPQVVASGQRAAEQAVEFTKTRPREAKEVRL